MSAYVWRLKTVLGAVAGNRDLRSAELTFALFGLSEASTWIAILVYAYANGGAAEAGLAAAVQLVPAALLAPFFAQMADRLPRQRVLVGACLSQAATLGLTAATIWLAAPRWAVYACAASAAVALTLTRPIGSAMLPGLVRTPDELTAGNVVSGWIGSVGYLVGPAAAGVLLAISGPDLVFAIGAGLCALGALVSAGIRSQRTTDGSPRAAGRNPFRGSLVGFRLAVTDPSVRVLVSLGGAMSILFGAVEVLCLAVAFSLFHLGAGGPGMLVAASGAGGVIGGAVTVLLIGRARLSPPLLVGLVVFGTALMAVGFAPLALALVLLAISGAGWSLADVAGRTLLQRISDDDVLARLFGVIEGIAMASYAVGSVLASALVVWLGARGAVLAAGATMPLLGLLTWRRLHAADRSAHVPTAEIAVLRNVRMFAQLPAPVIERLAHAAVTRRVAPGAVVVRQGAVGDRFYVVVDGTATVSVDGEWVRALSGGAHFGEIALLRDVPRTATVTALTDLTLLALDREPFLEAVTGHPQSLEAAQGVVDRLIDRGDT